ncbi:hypothetical protein BCR36DRAFT_582908 [Piromyces finnis]|uniref:SH3 domain-containing protein n=1 Tax=Piromyces finnis TaxID=1754191 RepID=A0A1Y1VAI4_9FUNG|nr:hypothetical protein BCR36DRAFT_582908 [Piromyces finnis]|eukprot:ORX51364.1 hypothetical protein BCR36DRAFT_582908 [Piromyces finnis]
MTYFLRKQALNPLLAFVTILANLNNFIDAKAIPENDESAQILTEDTKQNETIDNSNGKQNNIFLPIFSMIAISFFVSFGSVICFKSKKNKKDNIDKSKVTVVDLTLPYPSTIPRNSDTVIDRNAPSEESNADISMINQSMVRLKPVINERSVSIRRSIIVEKDYSNYCGFSPFPAPGFQFIAIYDYEAQSEDEISLTKNDPLLICQTFEDGWTIGKNCKNDQVGFFPITCLGIGPIEDESNEPTDTEVNLFKQMIIPNGRRIEE